MAIWSGFVDYSRIYMVCLFCSQPLILLWWIVPTIAKLNKMPLKPARKDKDTFSWRYLSFVLLYFDFWTILVHGSFDNSSYFVHVNINIFIWHIQRLGGLYINKRGRILFLSLNLSAVLKKSVPEKFAYNCHFQQIGINSTKIETTGVHFKSDVLAAVAIVDAKALWQTTGFNRPAKFLILLKHWGYDNFELNWFHGLSKSPATPFSQVSADSFRFKSQSEPTQHLEDIP